MASRPGRARSSLMKNLYVSNLIKNVKRSSNEEKGVILAHGLILFLILTPWVQITRQGAVFDIHMFHAENPAIYLLGLVSMISLLTLLMFIDRFTGLQKIKLQVPSSYLFLVGSIQQFILALLTLSVLLLWGKPFGETSIKIWFWISFIVIIGGALAAFLEIQRGKKEKAQSFFKNPSSQNSSENASSSEKNENTPRSQPTNLLDND